MTLGVWEPGCFATLPLPMLRRMGLGNGEIDYANSFGSAQNTFLASQLPGFVNHARPFPIDQRS